MAEAKGGKGKAGDKSEAKASEAKVSEASEAKASESIHWQLLENGIDFIREGVEAYFDDRRAALDEEPWRLGPRLGPRLNPSAGLSDEDLENLAEGRPTAYTSRPDHAYKYASLHLLAGCLLLFKERLRQEHECLIYSDVDVDPSRAKKTKTVDFDGAIGRLQIWAKVNLDPASLDVLRDLQKLRNNLEHFELKINKRQADAIVTATVEFAYRFLRDELGTNLEDKVTTTAWRRVRALRTIAEQLRADEEADWRRRCLNYEQMPAEELRRLAEDETDPEPLPLEWCGQCDEESVVLAEPDMYVCTNPECRVIEKADDCPSCGESTRPGQLFCKDCSAYHARQAERY